jgi:hypothetical protein
MGWGGVDWMHLVQDRTGYFCNGKGPSDPIKAAIVLK